MFRTGKYNRGRSRKGAWIEIVANKLAADSYNGRSRKGAWIEILRFNRHCCFYFVAPARERGLKFVWEMRCYNETCRSRKGAWIEMVIRRDMLNTDTVAPARERGLKLQNEQKI